MPPIEPPTPLPADLRDAAALAEWVEAERDRAVESVRSSPAAGLEAAAELTCSMDALVTALTRQELPSAGWTLLALGEWGLRELVPGSQLSGVLLSSIPVSVEPLTTALRRAGAEVILRQDDADHLVRVLSDDLVLAGELAEARCIVGDEKLFGILRAAVDDMLRNRGKAVIDSAMTDVEDRHRAEGGSVCRLEPDLVLNPGGLADFRLVRLVIGKLSPECAGLLEEEDHEDLAGAGAFLTACRIVLHRLAGARTDRLDHFRQTRLAAAMGYRSSDEADAASLLMRDVLRKMLIINRLSRATLSQHEERRAWTHKRRVVESRRPLGNDFTRIGGRIYLARPDLFEGSGAAVRMMQGFHRAATARLEFSQEFLKRVSDNLYAVNDEARRSPEGARLFREILAVRGAAANTLNAMHESGFLGAYLPEFGEIDCLVTGESTQRYTADQHSLMVVAALDRAELNGLPGVERAAALAASLPMGLLKLAALVHALGKSRGVPGFASRSAVMVPGIARQLGLDEREARDLVFLTEHQALLEETAGSRMTSDERLLAELVETIGETRRLDELYLLNLADLSTLYPEQVPAMRHEQLAALHARLSARMAARPARTRGHLADEAAALLSADLPRSSLDHHLSLVPERYLLEVSPADAALHVRLVAGMTATGSASVAVDWSRRRGHVHVWVLGPDRPRRISQIAGAVLCAGASIISARAYTRADGIIIDQFDLVPASDPGSEGSDSFWEAAAATIREVLTSEEELGGRSRLAVLLEGALRQPAAAGGAAPGGAEIAARVSFDNRVSADFTVVDVHCPDRAGLLYALSAGISDAGADIAFAKINTVDGVARDVFYITAGGAKVEDREAHRRIRTTIAAELRRLSG